MLKLVRKVYLEETNELVDSYSTFEGEVICLGKEKTKNDVFQAYVDECGIAQKLVNKTAHEQEVLDYWLNNKEKWLRYHKNAIESGDLDENSLRTSLTYYISKIQLLKDNNVISEKTFRYGY